MAHIRYTLWLLNIDMEIDVAMEAMVHTNRMIYGDHIYYLKMVTMYVYNNITTHTFTIAIYCLNSLRQVVISCHGTIWATLDQDPATVSHGCPDNDILVDFVKRSWDVMGSLTMNKVI